jgi:gliding motility-associated-like protein/uncharacterized repeat protein (TIGR01451 family)
LKNKIIRFMKKLNFIAAYSFLLLFSLFADLKSQATILMGDDPIKATIHPAVASFDLDDPDNIQTIITFNDATMVTAINDLSSPADYVITDYDGVTALLTINKSYLSTRLTPLNNELQLTITFDAGDPATLSINAMETFGKFAESEVFYDLADPTNVTGNLIWNTATKVLSVKNDNTALALNTDYQVGDTTITLFNTYLQNHLAELGQSIDLTVTFDVGTAIFTITAIQITSASFNPALINFNLDLTQDVSAGIVWNDAGLIDSLRDNQGVLLENTDYSVAGNIITIFSSYLVTKLAATGEQVILNAFFNLGKPATLTIVAVESNAAINPSVFLFDLDAPAPALLQLTWNDASQIVSIHDGTNNLNPGSDYTIEGNILTLSVEYLTAKLTLIGQSIALTVSFDKGNNSIIDISSTDSNRKWQLLGIPGFSPGNATYSTMDFDVDGVPYVAFSDATRGGKATVMKYNGISWIAVGQPGFTPSEAYFLSLKFDGNTPYLAFQDYLAGNDKRVTVMKFDGVSWQIIGNRRFSDGNADFVDLQFNNNIPWVAFRDYSRQSRATVMKLNGSAWEKVGIAGFSESIVEYVSLAFDGSGTPYLGFKDWHNNTRLATVMKFNGTSWSNVGSSRFSAGRVNFTSIAVSHDGRPYIAFSDETNGNRSTVMKYNGTSWEIVGSAGFSSGQADYISLKFNGTIPYVSFSDHGNLQKATVMKYTGNQWNNEGEPGFSAGAASFVALGFSAGEPHVAYQDAGNSSKATVMRYLADIVVSEVELNGFTVSWSRSFGDNAVVFMKKSKTGTALAINSVTYIASNSFGNGSQIGDSGWFAVYNGSGNSVNVTNLEQGSWYRIMVVEYTGTPGNEQYLSSDVPNNAVSQLTPVIYPDVQASGLTVTGIQSYQFDLGWVRGNGEKVAVFVAPATTGKPSLVQDAKYMASAVYKDGDEENGWYCVYSGTGSEVRVTGLDHDTGYRVMAIEFNGNELIRYNTSLAADNPVNTKTLVEPPRSLVYIQSVVDAIFRETDVNVTAEILGGPIDLFSIDPALPEGMEINAENGTISGIPQITLTETIFTITAANAGGQTTASFTLTINYASTPENPVSQIQVDNITTEGFTVNWLSTDSAREIVFLKQTTEGTPQPQNTVTYAQDSVFAVGAEIESSGWYSVYFGDKKGVSITGLDPDTWYRMMVIPYSGVNDGEQYLVQSSPQNPLNVITHAVTPDIQASGMLLTDIQIYQVNVGFTRGNGDKVVVFAKQGNTGTALPQNRTNYQPDPVFGQGTSIGESGWFCVHNGTESNFVLQGLQPDTHYQLMAFEYNGIPENESYLLNAEEGNSVGFKSLVLPPAPLTYAPAELTATMGVTEVSILPVHEEGGGAITTYTIEPPLPAGLSINALTGLISGVPLVLSTETVYTLKAINISGMEETTVSLTINDVPPSGISYNPSTVVAIADGDPFITVPLQAAGGKIINFSVEPALPEGITLNSETGIIQGISSLPLDETVFTITATNTGGFATAEFILTVAEMADLEIQTAINNPNAGLNENLTITFAAINHGPGKATGVKTNFNIPDGYTFVGHSGDDNFILDAETGSGIWDVGELERDTQKQFQIDLSVNATGNYVAHAAIEGNQPDSQQDNNTAESTIAVSDLRITLDLDNKLAKPGDTISFTLNTHNKGPADATSVMIDFVLNSGYRYVSHSGIGNYNPETGWEAGNISANSSRQIIIYAIVIPSANYDQTALVSALQHDANLADNTALNGILDSNLSIAMSLDNPNATTDDEVVFKITLTNNGPWNAGNVIVHDRVPDGYTYLGATTLNGSYNPETGIWSLPELTSGASAELLISAKVNPSGQYLNSAVVQHENYDNLADDNIASTRIKVSDLSISKTVSDPFAHVGDEIVFKLSVFNNGPDDAEHVLVDNIFPDRYKYISHSGIGNYDPILSKWTLSQLPVNTGLTIEITVSLEAYGDEFDVTALVTAGQHDPYLPDNDTRAAIIPPATADLFISAAIDEYRPIEHENATFTITASNQGRFYGNDALVQAKVPAGYEFVSAITSRGSYNSESGQWYIDTFPNATTETLIIEAMVVYDASYPYPMTVSLDATEPGSFVEATVDVKPIFYPIAHNDEILLNYKEQVVVDLASNDWDHYDLIDPASIVILQQPASNATVTVNNDGTITLDYSTAPQFVNSETIIYQISNVEGLSDMAELYVTVEVAENGHVIVPDAFSPNGDGINDTFVIPGIELISGNELHVFNRWGSLVFSKKDYDNSWDGKLLNSNSDVPEGTYFYTLTMGEGRAPKKGYVYIAR